MDENIKFKARVNQFMYYLGEILTNLFIETLSDYPKPQCDAQCPKDGREHQVQGSCQSVFQIMALPHPFEPKF